MLDAVGRRSFSPLTLLSGLVTLSPVGDIPGVPTMVAVRVLLLSTQLLWRRSSFWRPGWLPRKSIARTTTTKSIDWLERPARFIASSGRDFDVRRGCVRSSHRHRFLLISLAMPAMEVIPFSASAAGAALTGFGLAVIAREGLMALLALIFTVTTGGEILYHVTDVSSATANSGERRRPPARCTDPRPGGSSKAPCARLRVGGPG